MADQPLPTPPDPALDHALSDLGANLAFQPTPDLASSVLARLAAEPPRRSPVLRTFRPWSPLAARPWRSVAAALLLALFPDARTAVADRLGLRGVRIVLDHEIRTPAVTPVGANLLLGDRLRLDEARARVDFPIPLPDPAVYGQPDEAYVRAVAGGAMVSLLYYPRPGLPEAAETGVGALLMLFEPDADTNVLAKKITADGGVMDPVRVNGAPGYWVAGPSALVIDPDPSIGFERQPGRPSANVLLWERADLTYRLETALPRADALRFAESLPTNP